MSETMNILVTGASGDLGKATAHRLGRLGMNLGLQYRRDGNVVRELVKEIPTEAKGYRMQLDNEKNCHRLVDRFVEDFGGVDCLVQLHGDVHRVEHWSKLHEEDWLKDLKVNLVAPFFLAQRTVEHMKQRGTSGVVVMVSTASAAYSGGADSLAYGAAKCGVELVAKRLARDCASSGIRVNVLAPGYINTQFHGKTMKRSAKDRKARAKSVPLGKAGEPDDIAKYVEFLVSGGSNFVTGQVFEISGGDWL